MPTSLGYVFEFSKRREVLFIFFFCHSMKCVNNLFLFLFFFLLTTYMTSRTIKEYLYSLLSSSSHYVYWVSKIKTEIVICSLYFSKLNTAEDRRLLHACMMIKKLKRIISTMCPIKAWRKRIRRNLFDVLLEE